MNNKSIRLTFLSIIMLGALSGSLMAAEKAAVAVAPVDCSEDALLELRDPFAAQLPPKVITPSETSTKPAIVAPPVKEVPAPVAARPSEPVKPVDAGSQIQSKPSEPRLELTGIIFDTVKPKAIINGTVLSIGDSIDGSVVKSIRKGVVEIQYSGGIMKLRID